VQALQTVQVASLILANICHWQVTGPQNTSDTTSVLESRRHFPCIRCRGTRNSCKTCLSPSAPQAATRPANHQDHQHTTHVFEPRPFSSVPAVVADPASVNSHGYLISVQYSVADVHPQLNPEQGDCGLIAIAKPNIKPLGTFI
jgi:hypothetical protein